MTFTLALRDAMGRLGMVLGYHKKGISAQELERVDPEGKLWTGWSEWYGCAGQTFYEPSEFCAFPERRKLKSYS